MTLWKAEVEPAEQIEVVESLAGTQQADANLIDGVSCCTGLEVRLFAIVTYRFEAFRQ